MKNTHQRQSVDKNSKTRANKVKSLKNIQKIKENDLTGKSSKTATIRNKSQGQSTQEKESTTRVTRSNQNVSSSQGKDQSATKQSRELSLNVSQKEQRSVGKVVETTAKKSCSNTRQKSQGKATQDLSTTAKAQNSATRRQSPTKVQVSKFEKAIPSSKITAPADLITSKDLPIISQELGQADLPAQLNCCPPCTDETRIQNSCSNILFLKEEQGPPESTVQTQTLTQKRGRGRPRKHPLPTGEQTAVFGSRKQSQRAVVNSRSKPAQKKTPLVDQPEILKTLLDSVVSVQNPLMHQDSGLKRGYLLQTAVKNNSISSVINTEGDGKTDRKLEINGFSPFIDEKYKVMVSNFSPSNFKSVEKHVVNKDPYMISVGKNQSELAPNMLLSELQKKEEIAVVPHTDQIQKHNQHVSSQFKINNMPLQEGETCQVNNRDEINNNIQYNPNNQEKSFASPMDFKLNGQSRHHQNSILGSTEMNCKQNGQIHNFIDQDINMYDAELNHESKGSSEMKNKSNRQHLKRRAKEIKNSKYDESCFMVDYSGNRNKFTKNSELDVKMQQSSSSNTDTFQLQHYGNKSGQTTAGKIQSINEPESGGMKKSKRQVKQNLKHSEKEIKFSYHPDQVLSQIQQIKIDKLNDSTTKLAENENINELEEVQGKHKQIYSYGQKSNSRIDEPNEIMDNMRFAQMQQHMQYPQDLSNLNQEAELTTSSNVQVDGYGKMDIHSYGETQLNLIKHQQLNPHLYKRGPTKYQKQQNNSNGNVKVKGHWTEIEDKILTEAVRANGGKNWKKIAESLSERTDVQCLHRWQKVLNPALVKGPWTDIEDRLLLHLVNVDAPKHWTQIANHLPGRIGKQCRERWHNHLNPMIKRAATWTSEEEWILFLLNRDLANKWADIANILEGRTDNTIKNHWNSSMKKRIKEIQDEFAALFQNKIMSLNMKYIGCDPVEANDNGEPIHKNKVPKGFNKEYIKVLKDFEQELLNYKSQEVKHQNKKYYTEKCKDFIANSDNDSYFKAAANLMLTSGSEYLEELQIQYKDKMMCTDRNILNENIISVDEQQFSEIIDKVRNKVQEIPAQHIESNIRDKFDATPDQKKMINFDSSNTRGLDTDKENQQVNKPKRQSKNRKNQKINPFQEAFMDENQQMVHHQTISTRQPLKPIDRLTQANNALQEISNSTMYNVPKQQSATGNGPQVECNFTYEKFKQKEMMQMHQQAVFLNNQNSKANGGIVIKKQGVSNESNKIYTPFKNNSFFPNKETQKLKPHKQFSLADSLNLSENKQNNSDQSNKQKQMFPNQLSMMQQYGNQFNMAQLMHAFQNNSMNMTHFHHPENHHQDLNLMKPSGFLSNSKKVMSSAHSKDNRISSLISPNLKLMDSDNHQLKEMSTPKMKEVTKFNLTGAGQTSSKMDIKKPIATYQNKHDMVSKTLFSHDSGKQVSGESVKQQLYSNFKNMAIKNFGHPVMNKEISFGASKNTSSLEDMLCGFNSSSLNLSIPQNSNLNSSNIKNGPRNMYSNEEVSEQVFKEHEIIPQPSQPNEVTDTVKRQTE